MKLEHVSLVILSLKSSFSGVESFVTTNSNDLKLLTGKLRLSQHTEENTVTAVAEEPATTSSFQDELEARRQKVKASLFASLGSQPFSSVSEEGSDVSGYTDPILADPETKESLVLTTSGALLGGVPESFSSMKVLLQSSGKNGRIYQGQSNMYYDLLTESALGNEIKEEEPLEENEGDDSNTNEILTDAVNSLRVFIPPPLRNILATTGVLAGDDYIPMRDLFTSPQVSFAYERGWRQGFAAAGFPGADKEYEMVKEYFSSGTIYPDTVVDMSCATGLFTRRLAKGGDYDRVIGCDYSDSMLKEARRRIVADSELGNMNARLNPSTKLDLVRCDVGKIPMGTESVAALHAGAAMHCWPDLDAALSEIHRVLKPGGRFFASTFLASYFATVQAASGNDINTQAFQYFESVDMLKDLLLQAGFDDEKINVEILGTSCAIIRAEK